MATVSFRVSDELKKELDILSAEKGFHLSKLFRMAIEDIRDAMRHGPAGGTFDLSLKERLSLANQYRILELLDKEGADRHRENRDILTSGKETHYAVLLESFDGAPSLDVIREVMDILAMFTRLRLSADLLDGIDGVEDADIQFGGFHPDLEAALLSFTRFYVMKLGRHVWLCEQLSPGLESAAPMADIYRRMLAAWREYNPVKLLTQEEILSIVAARRGQQPSQAANATAAV